MMVEVELRTWITGYLAEYLEVPPAQISGESEFQDLGMDSVDAIVVAGALEDRFDVELDATLFLRCRNLDEVIASLKASQLLA